MTVALLCAVPAALAEDRPALAQLNSPGSSPQRQNTEPPLKLLKNLVFHRFRIPESRPNPTIKPDHQDGSG